MRKRIVTKIGSSSLAFFDGTIRQEIMRSVCRQKAELVKNDHEAVLVSSGAVAAGPRFECSKNLKAGVGMVKLIGHYGSEFEKYGIGVSMMLLLDHNLVDFSKTLKGRLITLLLSALGFNIQDASNVIKSTIEDAFRNKIMTIINANDTVDSKELNQLEKCADNDILSFLVARLIGADIFIILSDQPGVLDGRGRVIRYAPLSEKEKILKCANGGNSLGHGSNGMRTKIEVLYKAAECGMKAMLLPVQEENCILRAIAGEKNLGTVFYSD